jgi:hypothetical protein
MQNRNTQVPASQVGGVAGAGPATEQAPRRRVIFLNALPLNALPRSHIRLDIIPASISELGSWAQRRQQEGYEFEHFIRYLPTIHALRAAGVPLNEQPNAGLYTYRHGDIIVVVTLRNPTRGQEQTQVRPEDLEAWIVTVL